MTADDWAKIISATGGALSVIIGAIGLAYARLAAKRSKAAATGADDAVEAAGRAETAATGATGDLSREVAELRALVTKRLPAAATAAARAQLSRRPATLDDAAAVAARAEPAPVETPAEAPETPREEAADPITPGEAPQAPPGAAERPAGAAAPASLDTQAVWQVLGQRRP